MAFLKAAKRHLRASTHSDSINQTHQHQRRLFLKLMRNTEHFIGVVKLAINVISLSGRRVFDIATIRVSEISVYHKIRLRVPTSCKHLCTIKFAKA